MFIVTRNGRSFTASLVRSGYSKRSFVITGDLSTVSDADLLDALGDLGLGGSVRRINNDSQATVDVYTD